MKADTFFSTSYGSLLSATNVNVEKHSWHVIQAQRGGEHGSEQLPRVWVTVPPLSGRPKHVCDGTMPLWAVDPSRQWADQVRALRPGNNKGQQNPGWCGWGSVQRARWGIIPLCSVSARPRLSTASTLGLPYRKDIDKLEGFRGGHERQWDLEASNSSHLVGIWGLSHPKPIVFFKV